MAPQPALPVPTSEAVLELLLRAPALKAPAGSDKTMTTSGPDQVWYLVVAILCIAVPGIFLAIRIYTKISIVRKIEPADYFIGLAFPLIVVEIVLGWYMIKWGAGVHQWQVTYNQLFHQLYWMNTAEVVYCPLCFLVKMAILLQYLKLFAPTRQLNKVMWYGSWAMIIACFCFYTVFMFWTMFYCTPRRMIWYKFTPNGKCNDHSPIVISQGAFNMASDIIILLLPTSSLWKLHVPRGRKIVITLLFATGLLACAASIMRIIFTIKIAPVLSMSDVSHNGLFIGLWTEAEVALCFIVACSLSLPKLIQAKRKHFTRAKTFVSSPFSSSRGARTPTGKSISLKSTLKSKGTQVSSDEQEHNYVSERHHAPFNRERYYSEQYGSTAHIAHERITPSPGSQYSRSVYSRRTSNDDPTPQPQASYGPADADHNAYGLGVYTPKTALDNDSFGMIEPPVVHHTHTASAGDVNQDEPGTKPQSRISRPGRHSRSAQEFIALGHFDFGSSIDVAQRP